MVHQIMLHTLCVTFFSLRLDNSIKRILINDMWPFFSFEKLLYIHKKITEKPTVLNNTTLTDLTYFPRVLDLWSCFFRKDSNSFQSNSKRHENVNLHQTLSNAFVFILHMKNSFSTNICMLPLLLKFRIRCSFQLVENSNCWVFALATSLLK